MYKKLFYKLFVLRRVLKNIENTKSQYFFKHFELLKVFFENYENL